MSTHRYSEKSAIRDESELVLAARALIQDPEIQKDRGLAWALEEHGGDEKNITIKLDFDNFSVLFRPEFRLQPDPEELKGLAKRSGAHLPLLITPRLSPRIERICRDISLSALDLNGRVFIRNQGVLIYCNELPGRRFRFTADPRNIFSGKSLRIIRCLLSDRDKEWRQAEIVDRTKVSSGLASRIVNHLVGQGFLRQLGKRSYRVQEHLGLVNAWVEADRLGARVDTRRYSTLGGDPQRIARSLLELAGTEGLDLAFTQWIAGWLRHPCTEPVVVSAYITRFPREATLKEIGLRPVEETGNVWLHQSKDEGVFQFVQSVQGLPVVSDAQIVVDLHKAGLRADDQVDALRKWEGFCRP